VVVVEVFVEVDSVSRVSGGGGECKHEIRDGTCPPGVQNPKAAGIEAELCNEEGVMREDWDADGVGYEAGDDVVGSPRKGAIPISPIGRGCVRLYW
jgi:hypothetical protein